MLHLSTNLDYLKIGSVEASQQHITVVKIFPTLLDRNAWDSSTRQELVRMLISALYPDERDFCASGYAQRNKILFGWRLGKMRECFRPQRPNGLS